LGGKIWAENNPDKGAVFCKPLIKPNETEKKVPLLQAKVHFEPQKLKILVAR
jgi:hypothetical protein